MCPVSATVCLITRHGSQTQQAADVRLSSGLPGRQLKSSGDKFMQVTASGGKLNPSRANRRMPEQELASLYGLKEVGNKLIKVHIPPPQPVKRMTLLCKKSMHLDSHMTTSAGLSCEAFDNAMVCKMQPKCSEMRLRCGGCGCRRCHPSSSSNDDGHGSTPPARWA